MVVTAIVESVWWSLAGPLVIVVPVIDNVWWTLAGPLIVAAVIGGVLDRS